MSIEELKAAYAATEQKEWQALPTAHFQAVVCLTDAGNDVRSICEVDTKANSEFIALAHNLMPKLIKAADQLRIMVEVFNTGKPDPLVAFVAIEQARGILEKLK